MRNLLLCLALASLAAACASSPEALDKQDSATVQNLLNAGKAGELAALSSQPFVVDQEIVALPADTASYWTAMAKAGLRIEAGTPGRSVGLTAASYRAFADTMEMRVFFQKYLDAKTRLLTLAAGGGKSLLVLVRNDMGKTTIFGVKGPY